ncbi:hypothetical protein L1987_22365 [Smallanthus sonchifolius]|uniref:Uncharacterized protein n=1 Tax=Smallanthus sonchifolius TaxID=185202 RepID=A0ACB9IFJ7_9ASTR|nr:hypothetical protein L1987_22365 [Smallanthus sonchifolius]
MPFGWKKKTTTRCNRFSRLVADHLQSPKRGGSLVVETGFPTSLIDLYVRNRGRFRRSSAKKQRGNDSPTPLSSPPPSPPTSPSPSSGLNVDSHNLSSYSLVDSNNLSSRGSDHRGIDEIIEEDVVLGTGMVASDDEIQNSTKIDVKMSVEMVKLNPALVFALKVLLMVVLVLGTKRFTVGITVSAFLLVFMELVGKLLLGRSRSVDSETVSESSVREIENVESSEENVNLVVCSGVLEIEEEVESKQEVRSEKELDELRSEVSMEIRRKSSRRAIMKSRMKKLVPKKFLKSSMGSKEEETVKFAQGHKPLDSKGETLRILKQNQDEIVEIEGRSLSTTLSSEIDCSDEELGRILPQNSGCLVLCLIVLIGLIGGRSNSKLSGKDGAIYSILAFSNILKWY